MKTTLRDVENPWTETRFVLRGNRMTTAAKIWLKYGRDLNVREAEHALAGIDYEMGRLRADNERLRERLGPRGLEVVEIDGAGHYVNAKVKEEITRLRAELELERKECKIQSELRENRGAENDRLRADKDALLAAMKDIDAVAYSKPKGAIGLVQQIARAAMKSVEEK